MVTITWTENGIEKSERVEAAFCAVAFTRSLEEKGLAWKLVHDNGNEAHS